MSRLLKAPFAVGALALGAIAAGGASQALALTAPGITAPASPSRSTSWTFSWSAVQPDPGYDGIVYEGGFDGALTPFGTAQSATLTTTEGNHTFQVRAVQTSTLGLPAAPGPAATAPIRVDTLPPSIKASFPPPNGLRGWYRLPFTVSFVCSDASAVTLCGPAKSFAAGGSSQGQNFVTGRAVDVLGNTSAPPLRVGPFNIDMLVPSESALSTPGAGAVVGAEPTFTWARNRNGETSGYEHYELQVQIGNTWRTIANVPYPQSGGRLPDSFSATRQPAVWGTPLPERVALQWRVTTFDNAGNQRSSSTRKFTIDSTAPASPAITQGPSGPVRDTQPTFSWAGTAQAAFVWSVTPEGADVPAQSGSGPATTATLQALPDGPYVFSVSQVSAAGVPGVEATRSFTVDTVAPPPPTITSRPPVPSNVAGPSYAWTGEEGSTFRWQVLTAAGASAQSPVETAAATATVGPFGPGAYVFRVSQVDRAGNVSGAAVDALTIAGAVAAPRPAVARLPALRSAKLSPKPNTTLMTKRPNFGWQKGPAGTTLYNLQVFRVGKKGSPSTKVVKVFSAFPRHRHYRPAAGKLRAGFCYVWRVWPYVGSGFTKEPLGVSNFCVGTAKQLKSAARRRAR